MKKITLALCLWILTVGLMSSCCLAESVSADTAETYTYSMQLISPDSAGPGTIVELPLDETGGMPFQINFTSDTMTYDDPTIHVERSRIRNHETKYNCTVHYAKVRIADASQLRTASCRGFDNRSVARVDVIGRQVNAVLAINGDFFGSHKDGYILRQGTVYRDMIQRKCDILLIDEDGDFHIIPYDADQENIDKTQWNGKKVYNAFTFGPVLILNDEVVLDIAADPAHADAPGRGARTAIVQTGHLEYMVITCREVGVTLEELTSLIQELTDHVECAYVLDGGLSSQMAFAGRLINKLADKTARPVTDIVYFASAWKTE